MDFMSDALFDGKKFRVLTLVDNYSRKSLVLHTGISIKGEDVAEILKKVTFEILQEAQNQVEQMIIG